MKIPHQNENDSYYTSSETALSTSSIVENISASSGPGPIRILEPSVGAGDLLPEVLRRLGHYSIILDVVDIDPRALEKAKNTVEQSKHTNIEVRYIEGDFLEQNLGRYDLVVANPPFGSTRGRTSETSSDRLYLRFLRRILEIADFVSIIIPKYFLEAPGAADVRSILSDRVILKLHDLGMRAFPGVLIETIILQVGPSGCKQDDILIESIYKPGTTRLTQKNLVLEQTGTWHMYSTPSFREVLNRVEFVDWNVHRDRVITKPMRSAEGEVPVLRGRGIAAGLDMDPSASEFVSSSVGLRAGKFARQSGDVIAVPNLSYYPRACWLPQGWVADGSVAQLSYPGQRRRRQEIDLPWYSSDIFFNFYRVARNYSVRSLNVDALSSKYWVQPAAGWSYARLFTAHKPYNLFDFDWSL